MQLASVIQGEGFYPLPHLNSYAVPPFCKFSEINEDPQAKSAEACCDYAVAIAENIVNLYRHVLHSTVFVIVSCIMFPYIKT